MPPAAFLQGTLSTLVAPLLLPITCAHAILFTLKDSWQAALGFQDSAIFSLGCKTARGKVPEPPFEFWHWCN